MLRTLERKFRHFFPKRLINYKQYQQAVVGKSGLEIGGPSWAFSKQGFLPVYSVIENLDGCNFSSNTVWEGNISEGKNYRFDQKTGYQYISDGTDLSFIKSEHYDFILSSHSIEHFANPLKAIFEWKRVLKMNGLLIMIVPHKDNTFDHNRPITTLDHLVADYKNGTSEHDSTHFEEILSLHDLSMDPGGKDIIFFKERTLKNFENRCIHHHVFNTRLAVEMVDYAGFQIDNVSHFNPYHIIILARKLASGINNDRYLEKNTILYTHSRFPSDK
jgi:SAM-dependent methyltransferase